MKKKFTMEALQVAPPPFNMEARPGLDKAISSRYAEFCALNPCASQEERRDEYQYLYETLRVLFPSYKEMEEIKRKSLENDNG